MAKHQNFWVKVTCPERMTVAGPPYDDVVPFAKTLVDEFPDRVIWGTDWPHPNMKKEAPDDGVLVDRIPHIATTAAAAAGAADRQSDAALLELRKLRSVDQQMRRGCSVSFRQLRTSPRTRAGQLCASSGHGHTSAPRRRDVV